MTDPFLVRYIEGMAALLAAAGTGLAWSPDAAYTPDQTGIWYPTAPDAPARAVTLNAYPLTADPTMADSTIGLQVRTRSAGRDIRDAYALDGLVADVLHGNYPITLATGVRVQTILRTSAISPTRDDQNRWNGLSNWTTSVYEPGTHRL